MNIFDQIAENYPKRTLSPEETGALVRAAQRGDNAATLQLVSNYIPLFKTLMGREISNDALNFTDVDNLRSAAIEGFMDALGGVTEETGSRLDQRVRLRVVDRLREVRKDASSVRIPHTTFRRCLRVLKIVHGDRSKAIDRAADFNVQPETMYAFLNAYTLTTRPDEDFEADQRPQIRVEDIEDATRALDVLDPTSRIVIETLYGFGREPLSERRASEELNIPRTSLQRTAKAALEKMRAALGA